MRTTSGSRKTAAAGGNRPTRFVLGLAMACAAAVALTGCSTEDAICGGGEYPVLAVGTTGKACAPNGQEPPKGYVRYPEGKVPQHVGDTWDTYWNTHTIDKNGNIVEASATG